MPHKSVLGAGLLLAAFLACISATEAEDIPGREEDAKNVQRPASGEVGLPFPGFQPDGAGQTPKPQAPPKSALPEQVGLFDWRKDADQREKAVQGEGGSAGSQSAVDAALAFLARVQQPDGHWSSAADGRFESGDPGQADLAVTGLALLCFEGAGHSEAGGKYEENVRNAVVWLKQEQSVEGAWTHGGEMHGHGICTMAMAEAYGMARGLSQAYEPARRAVDYIAKVQGPGGGYSYDGPGSETSITAWQVFAVKSANAAGLDVPRKTTQKMKKYLEEMLNPSTGITGYSTRGQGSNTMTAAGLCCRLFLGQNRPNSPLARKIAGVIHEAGPQVDQEYELYYGTLAMFQMGGKRWKKWNDGFRDQVVARQLRTGNYAGSWDPANTQYGSRVGRVYVTCMYTLCLEVYYRYAPVAPAARGKADRSAPPSSNEDQSVPKEPAMELELKSTGKGAQPGGPLSPE